MTNQRRQPTRRRTPEIAKRKLHRKTFHCENGIVRIHIQKDYLLAIVPRDPIQECDDAVEHLIAQEPPSQILSSKSKFFILLRRAPFLDGREESRPDGDELQELESRRVDAPPDGLSSFRMAFERRCDDRDGRPIHRDI